ncbi:MAG: hypothetical protein U5L04_02125 [Trueperaceae bacterium]|nr:hypothetical protein [Trueperaceae bacterium]
MTTTLHTLRHQVDTNLDTLRHLLCERRDHLDRDIADFVADYLVSLERDLQLAVAERAEGRLLLIAEDVDDLLADTRLRIVRRGGQL